jgi:hypothetical protein
MPTESSGEAEGVAVEYFKLIAEKMALENVEFRLHPLKRLLVELEQNRLDMALLFGKNPERESVFIYPRNPFCRTRPSVAVKASHPLKNVRSVEDLLPWKSQESAGANRTVFIRDPRFKLEPLYGDNYTMRCYFKLVKERIDACYQPDHYPLVFETEGDFFALKIRVLELPEPPIGLYSVFSKKSADRYLERYEAALEEVRREKSYEELFRELYGTYR